MATWKEGVVYRYVATGLVLTSVLFSACGDDDDGGGGTAGGSGASTAGTAGNAAAGKANTAGSSSGGSGAGTGPATGGASQGGASGGMGQAGSTAAGGGGAPTTAGAGGSAGAAQGGSGGGEPASIEYRACEQATALSRIAVHRIDEDAGTCTRVVLLQGNNCSLGVAAGNWCLEQAVLSADVAACKALTVPGDSKMASSATGNISVSGVIADVNVMLTFPAGGGLPTSITVAANDCSADCMMNDCRP